MEVSKFCYIKTLTFTPSKYGNFSKTNIQCSPFIMLFGVHPNGLCYKGIMYDVIKAIIIDFDFVCLI